MFVFGRTESLVGLDRETKTYSVVIKNKKKNTAESRRGLIKLDANDSGEIVAFYDPQNKDFVVKTFFGEYINIDFLPIFVFSKKTVLKVEKIKVLKSRDFVRKGVKLLKNLYFRYSSQHNDEIDYEKSDEKKIFWRCRDAENIFYPHCWDTEKGRGYFWSFHNSDVCLKKYSCLINRSESNSVNPEVLYELRFDVKKIEHPQNTFYFSSYDFSRGEYTEYGGYVYKRNFITKRLIPRDNCFVKRKHEINSLSLV